MKIPFIFTGWGIIIMIIFVLAKATPSFVKSLPDFYKTLENLYEKNFKDSCEGKAFHVVFDHSPKTKDE